jgi:SAM-dependent methyltransferase
VHVETAVWTRAALARIEPPAGARALDIGSSTLHYRTVEQPHIEELVLAPLRERGVRIVHLDAKAAAGVDVVCDLDAADEATADRLGEHALVLLTSVLHYLRRPERAADLAVRALAPGGHLVAHHPATARRTYDPLDRGLRMSPGELASVFESRGLECVRADSLRIDDPRYYRGLWSRPSWIPVAGGRAWLPLPGATDRARLRVPALRWRQSCVVMRRPGTVAP